MPKNTLSICNSFWRLSVGVMMLLSIDNLSDKLSGNLPPTGKHFTPFLRKDKDNDSVITRNAKVKKIL